MPTRDELDRQVASQRSGTNRAFTKWCHDVLDDLLYCVLRRLLRGFCVVGNQAHGTEAEAITR
jgi:hypothetical protein